MRPTEFDPKAGSLELSFTNGASYSIDLNKKYHREEAFYVDLYWEEFKAGTTLSLALHPKSTNLVIGSCKLIWPLVHGAPSEVLTQGFTLPTQKSILNPNAVSTTPGFWEKRAIKKINAYDPIPHPLLATSSYQSITLKNNRQFLKVKSTDESAALTVFSHSRDRTSLVAENQSEGYQLRHTFPAFELQFEQSTSKRKTKSRSKKPIYSLIVSPEWTESSTMERLTNSALFDEGNFNSIILQDHESPCPGQAGFDESLYTAFAKTCSLADMYAGICLSPFVVMAGAANTGIKAVQEAKFKRWSTSLCQWIYPIDLSGEDSMRSCEQHLLRYYRIGFRLFIVNDIAASLRDGIGSTTTGQQLTQRLDALRRVLPEATILLGDLIANDAASGFQGFCATGPAKTRLPRIAKFAGMGTQAPELGSLTPFRIPAIKFAPPVDTDSGETHELLDISTWAFDERLWIALESTLGQESYPA